MNCGDFMNYGKLSYFLWVALNATSNVPLFQLMHFMQLVCIKFWIWKHWCSKAFVLTPAEFVIWSHSCTQVTTWLFLVCIHYLISVRKYVSRIMKDHVYEILSGKKLINVLTHLRWWTAWAGAEEDAGKDGEVEEVESQESIEDLCTCCCHSCHF